jgi:FAD binding domain in molybdopterin dehydrogenase
VSLNPQYARPRSAQQAVELLEGLGAGAMVIAGGQELMPHMNYGRLMPGVLVDIGGIAELRGITEDTGRIAIGALTSHRELQTSALVRERLPLLAFAAQRVGGGWQVHNRGTVGGNIVAMHPLYDIAPALIALDTEVDVQTSAGTRRVALAALISETAHGLGTTSILTRILVKQLRLGQCCGRRRRGRRQARLDSTRHWRRERAPGRCIRRAQGATRPCQQRSDVCRSGVCVCCVGETTAARSARRWQLAPRDGRRCCAARVRRGSVACGAALSRQVTVNRGS